MTEFTPDRENGHDGIDIKPRTERALSEPLSVVSLDGTPVKSTDETVVMVVSHSGESYHVDAAVGRCECPDHKHRDAECKHIRRARIELGKTTLDSRVLAAVDIDSQLGANAPGPQVATSDGGIIDAGDGGEILDESSDTDDGRPEDCTCAPCLGDLPCWPCYRDGFDVPNPNPSDEENDGDDGGDREEPTRSEHGDSTGVQDL